MTITRPLKIGFIGGGLNSSIGATHFAAARLDGLWQVASGFFSRDDSVNRDTGQAWRINPKRTYGSLESFIDGEAGCLDAVAVLTPIPSHCPISVALLRAGFNVISEKPLAGTVSDGLSIRQAAADAESDLLVTLNYSGYPMLRELRARVADGQFGKIHAVHVEMPQETFLRRDRDGNPPSPQDWRQVDGAIPTVSLDLGIHVHHVVQFLLGLEPLSVVALQGHSGLVSDVIDDVYCLAKYPGSGTANLWFGKTFLGTRNGLMIRLAGDEGSCTWVQTNPEVLYLSDRSGQQFQIDRGSYNCLVANGTRYERFKVGHPAGFIEAFGNLYADMASVLGQEGVEDKAIASTYVTRPDQALAGLEMMSAISRSAESGNWEPVLDSSKRCPSTFPQ